MQSKALTVLQRQNRHSSLACGSLCRVGTSAAEQYARPSMAQNLTNFLSLTLFFLRALVQVSHLAGP